jgi:RHS repeat-associated protein
MTSQIRALLLIGLLITAATNLHAQVRTGTPPFGSFGGGPEVINLANLNSHITIPVLHKAGRGTNFTYDLSYDSSVWYPVGSSGNQYWQPVYNMGWRAITEVTTGYIGYNQTISGECGFWKYLGGGHQIFIVTGYTYDNTNWIYHDTFGVQHPFNGSTIQYTGSCSGTNTSFNATSIDGSGYQLQANGGGGTVISSLGGVVVPPVQAGTGSASFTDRNGNQLSADGSGHFYDTLSSTTPVLTVASSGSPTTQTTFTYTAPSGASPAYKMNFASYTVATNFGNSAIHEYKSQAAVQLVSSIVLPDGSSYTFNYEPTPSVPASGACTPYGTTTCVTGRISSITLPTGGSGGTSGTITYFYSFSGCTSGNNGILPDGSTSCLQRTTPDGTWTYAQVKGTGAASTTTITAPQLPYDSAANQTVIQFQGIYETQRQVYQGASGSGTLLQSWNTCYNGAASPCTGTAITLPIQQRTVIDQYGSSGFQSKHNYLYNAAGGVTEADDYDYGKTGPSTTPLRKTLISFASLGNITAFQQQVIVQNGAGTPIAQTNYNYDEVAPTATSGITQHTSPGSSRGNLTSINYPISSLTSHFTYWDTGSINTAQDVNGATTTYTYSSNTASCQMAFPTGITEAISGLSQSLAWNCTGGVGTSVTDENGNTSSTSYTTDAYYWRPNAATDTQGNQTVFYYQPNSTYNSYETAWTLTFNNGNSQASDLKYQDGLGRTYVDQHEQSPSSSSLDSVSYTFDSNGRPYSVSMPCTASWAGTCSTPKTTTTYDALNRLKTVTDGGSGTASYSYQNNDVLVTFGPPPTGENAKQRLLEYDSLGHLTSVCEITSGATGWPGGTCAQNFSPQPTGYLTTYTYDALGKLLTVTQNAQSSSNQQTRTYNYDAMSRLTSEKNPETSQSATMYTYDSDTTCTPASKGDLVKRVDAVGNTICYAYDLLHRLTGVTYPYGAYAGATPAKTFVYDSATVNGVAMVNAKSRLAEAYTSSGSCTGKCTDIGFSYSARGETSDVFESTQHSSGYYHVNQTYGANGAPNQLSQLIGLPTITYGGTIGSTVGLDGEGRITQVTASGTGQQNPVTGVTYNNGSLPTQVNYGSGDTDIFAYDSNTLRMTQFQFKVGTQAQSLTGILTWNANSTLSQLAITDQFNSANTQTCNYTHDDLTRIVNANCGNAAAQTFSYDPFGNIAKSGSPFTFQPTYSPSTNHMTAIGSLTPSYDANGNVLIDSLHNYAWDADGNSTAVDNVSLTFDALDRMIEQNRSGAYTQIVYDPSGAKLALMNGQSLVKAFVPLPGQATAVYTSNGLDHYRHSDWLGSARLTSSPSRAFLSSTAYAPFGESYAQSGSSDLSFTGQNPDTVSGDYDFLAREYSNQGRWPSPDPVGFASADSSDPQSWNRYAYVRNSPLMLVDPLGAYPVCFSGTLYDEVDFFVDSVYSGSDFTPLGSCDYIMWLIENRGSGSGIPPLVGGSGGGRTNGPTMRAGAAPSHCRIVDPVLGAIEIKFKAGLEVDATKVHLGGALYKNLMTGETGGQLTADSGLIGVSIDRPTPPGGSISGGSEPAQVSFSFFGFNKNVTTGAPVQFQPSKDISLGLVLGVGFEAVFNPDKFDEISQANAACEAQGGH